MSTLWTPGGEHPVDPAGEAASAGSGTPPGDGGPDPDAQPDPEEARRFAEELVEARRRLAAVPAGTVVANHAFGIYELAAIHLTDDPPRLGEAQVAIDALAALVDGVGTRLGEALPPLREGLDQLRLLYVQVHGRQSAAAPRPGAAAIDPDDDDEDDDLDDDD